MNINIYTVLEESGIAFVRVQPDYPVDRSEEYWTGWALAYYQWKTGLSFEEIVQYISIKDAQVLCCKIEELLEKVE